MAVASRPRAGAGWNWRSPWLFVAIAVVLVVAGALGAAFGTGFLGRGGGQTPPPSRSPSPAVSASPSPSPSPVASPSPAPPPSVVARLHGKIAVSSGEPGSGGWIAFPGGGFTADAASRVYLPGGEWRGLTQSLALNRWLPVPRDWVTPDGKSYAYVRTETYGINDYFYKVTLVTAGQAPRDLKMPVLSTGQVPWEILEASANGVYITPPSWGSGSGLYRLSYTGDPKLITSKGSWTETDGTYAYGTLTASVPQGAATTVVRVEIASGSISNVFSQPGMRSTAVGIDRDGSPVILAVENVPLPTLAQLWIAGPSGPVKIFETALTGQPSMGPNPQGSFMVSSVVADTVGTWISTSKGLYLYSKEAGFEFASQVTGPLASAFRSS